MKVREILLELKFDKEFGHPKEHDQYWVYLELDKIKTIPRMGTSTIDYDVLSFFADKIITPKSVYGEYKDAVEKKKDSFKIDYANANNYGWMMVDNVKKQINLDITKYTGTDNRRLATKIKSFNHKAKNAYPVLGGEVSFGRVTELRKVLSLLAKYDPRTEYYTIVGDDRVPDGTTPRDLHLGKVSLDSKDHSKIFNNPKQINVTLYHGTSKKQAKAILKNGLRSGERVDTYVDLVPNYSDKNVYLAFSPAEAANYATREAINSSSDAVILEVELTPAQVLKLRPDEDSMHWLDFALTDAQYDRLVKKIPIVVDLWGPERRAFNVHFKNLNHKDGKFNLGWILTQYGVDSEFKRNAEKVFKERGLNTDEALSAVEKNVYVELIRAFTEASFSKNIKQVGTTAYPGNIPASQIKVLKTWSLADSKIPANNYGKANFDAAIDKQQSSVVKK